MSPVEYWNKVEELLNQALSLEFPQQQVFLDSIEDRTLREEVSSLVFAGQKVPGPHVEEIIQHTIGTAALQVSLEGKKFGSYEINRLLAIGGMSEVYLARDTRLHRSVALKLLPPEFHAGEELLARFEREARVASALNHPNIVTIYEIAENDGHVYIATEYVEGISLHEYAASHSLAIADVLRIGEQIASALAVAHQAGIVHRDIKPSNIMVRPDGLIKVLDFGLARTTDVLASGASPLGIAPMTVAGTVLGTPRYMSPEQARGRTVDGRSDLWSLGAVLYELLTGRPAVSEEELLDILIAVTQRSPDPLPASISPGIQAMVYKLLAKDPAERHQSAADVLRDLQSLRFPAATPLAVSGSAILRSKHWLFSVVGTLLRLAAVLAFFSYRYASSPMAVEHKFTYFITAQVLDGNEADRVLQVSSRQVMSNNSHFRLNVSAPEAGFFYVLDEDDFAGGKKGYTALFPLPSVNNGSAEIKARQVLHTGWYRFSQEPGKEKLWLVWGVAPIGPLEALRTYLNARDKGAVSDPAIQASVSRLLERTDLRGRSSGSKPESRQTTISAASPTVISSLELIHR